MMKEKRHQKKKSTIFRIFLIPLIAIMLVQGVITIGTLVARGTVGALEDYSGGMMARLVENRRVILQNEMNQRWSMIRGQEAVLDSLLARFLSEEGAEAADLPRSAELRIGLLERLFPECLDMLDSNSTTGIFLILTGTDPEEPGDYDGFFIRDSEPNSNSANYADLLLERGDKRLSRGWNIPLDTSWTTRFHMDGRGANPADNCFYEPWRAGADYPDADTADLGYWSLPFHLEKETADSYEMITYSLPLRHQGRVYGVLGVEVSSRTLYDYFPVTELNDAGQSGYMLAVRRGEGGYTPLVGKGMLYDVVRAMGGSFTLRETDYEHLSLVEGAKLNGDGVYAVTCPLRLYSNNVPYDDTEWVLLGLDTGEDLFGMSRRLYVWMMAAVLIGLAFGVFGIYLTVSYLTKPVQQLMQCISKGRAGLREFKPSNILEIDALYDVVTGLSERQKEAENILLEEKERYKVALESSKDVFFSYDLQTCVLDLVNHKTMSGQWRCSAESSFINADYIYGEDRARAMEALGGASDELYAEFRLKWPGDERFAWVAVAGKAVYDTDGRRWKLVGSIRDIQEQKEREAEQLRKNTTDGVTGLYCFSAGMERIAQRRNTRPDGVMAVLYLDRLKQTTEENGIVFGDMILEEVGGLIRERCGRLFRETGLHSVALRLNRDEFVLWLEGQPEERAAEFVGELVEEVSTGFRKEDFSIRMYAGLACAGREQGAEQLARMAKLARVHALGDAEPGCLSFRDVPGEKRAGLPALQAHEVNTLGYGEEVSLVSTALNLFGKGADFSAQMMLLIRKIGRSYRADGVLVSMLRADFNSIYLNYQWYRDGRSAGQSVRKYREQEKEDFFRWLGQSEARYFDQEDSGKETFQCFLSVAAGERGVVLPMYDSGSYMGNLCILGVGPELLEDPEGYQDLAELGRVIQSQLNQQQHDIASKAKSEFLSRMSHEIRTPMNGIIGMTAIALQPGQGPERVTDCLQKIQSSSNYLLGLINDILDMSKIESGKMKLESVNFDMDEMLATIRELIAPQAAAKRIVLEWNAALSHRWFLGDRMRVSQVLINLLGNAVKFTPEQGRVILDVRESEAPGGRTLVSFSVRDTGIGIAGEDQERVFRSFEQAGGANPAKQQGTGLGLSISSRLVQMMGSEIRLVSAPGEGSTFSFAIPLALGESTEREEEKEELSFEGYRVLVVEDNELNAEIARCLLEERGLEVDCAGDGAQAVERIRTTPPGTYDLVLMDIMMPVMDGLEATRTIRAMEREDCRRLPIIAMSANAFDDDLKKSVECGMDGHLSKPVEVDKLYQTLDKVIRGRKK